MMMMSENGVMVKFQGFQSGHGLIWRRLCGGGGDNHLLLHHLAFLSLFEKQMLHCLSS